MGAMVQQRTIPIFQPKLYRQTLIVAFIAALISLGTSLHISNRNSEIHSARTNPKNSNTDKGDFSGFPKPRTVTYYESATTRERQLLEISAINRRRRSSKLKADTGTSNNTNLLKRVSSNKFFDLRRGGVGSCTLCLWIQPNFAAHFNLSGEAFVAVAEVVAIIRMLDWSFRSLDINSDGIPDGLGFTISDIIVKDIQTDATMMYSTISIQDKDMSRTRIQPADIIRQFQSQLNSRNYQTQQCCVNLAFTYTSMKPLLSVSIDGGACSVQSAALVSGNGYGLTLDKTTSYDIFRSAFQALSQSLGAVYDDNTDPMCKDLDPKEWNNPFSMSKKQELNVGMRINSMSLSMCSKRTMSAFFTSNENNCFHQTQSSVESNSYCGNGIKETGEDCDCGSIWECVQGEQCCGFRGSNLQCQLLLPHNPRGSRKQCESKAQIQ